MPISDIIFMLLGTGAFLYFTFSANKIINQGTRFESYQIIIGIIGILALVELTRRCVGLPILIVAGFFLIYALAVGLTNGVFWQGGNSWYVTFFYTKEGIFSTPVNVCSKYIVVFIILVRSWREQESLISLSSLQTAWLEICRWSCEGSSYQFCSLRNGFWFLCR